jgi:hypothetical protein
MQPFADYAADERRELSGSMLFVLIRATSKREIIKSITFKRSFMQLSK